MATTKAKSSGGAQRRNRSGVRSTRTKRAVAAQTSRKVVTVEQSTGSPVDVEPLRVKIAVVADALGSKAKAAEFLGVARSQPGRWLAGDERPNPRARRLIQDLDYVWDRLTDDRASEAANIWLDSANSFLNGATPLTWLKTRGPDEVIAAIDAEEAGSYA